MIDELFTAFVPEYLDLLQEVISFFFGVFVGGVLLAFIAWSIGYTVHSVYRWLNDTTRET